MKRATPQRIALDADNRNVNLTAGAGAATAASASHFQAGSDLKPHSLEIHLDRLGFLQQVLVGDKLKSVKIENLIHVIGFIQNQRQ